MNGLHVILLLLVPILLTAITLLGLRLQQTTMRKILLWSPAVVLLGFCFVAIAPPKDTDGRREESGRGVRELQGK